MNPMVDASWSQPWIELWQDLALTLPRLFSALLLLAIGIGLAMLLRRLVRHLLQRGGADQALSNYFVFQVWSRRRKGESPSQSLGNAAGYACLFIFALASARVLGGDFGREMLAGLMLAAPRFFTVLLILLLSVLLASGLGLLVQLVLAGSGSRHTALWGRAVGWGTFVAGALFALEPLGLAGQVLTQALLIALAGVALAVGLAFGLGCKDLAREMLLELMNPDKDEN